MRKSLFILPIIACTFGFVMINKNRASHQLQSQNMLQREYISCGLAFDNEFYADASGKFISLLPGRGDHSYTVTTKSDSAQLYFNQGLSMYYSYHAREAFASFREAARFDSNCVMAYWGQALTLGPSYNFGYNYKMNKKVPAVLQSMNRAASYGNSKEKDLVVAMNTRYNVNDSADTKRKELNVAYVNALKPLVQKYNGDLDIKALYTDAVMLVHPWEFWNNDGTPKSWTPELVKNCREILAKDPHHPGALHYYIHVTEASRQPEVALSSADSLIKLFPGIAHMVHMSSHEYERTGQYMKGVIANEKADRSLVVYDSLAKGLFPRVHVPHYYEVDAFCAMSGAMYQKSKTKCMTLRQSVEPDETDFFAQYNYLYYEFALVRMGKWEEILNDNVQINDKWIFARLLNNFAQGMAAARTGKTQQAETNLQQLRDQLKNEVLKEKLTPFASSPYEIGLVAENLLQANILFESKKYTEALDAVKKAIHAEDQLLYSEPKFWLIPSRQYQGVFLMHLKKYKEAESVYREDLEWNPGMGWSQLGLYQALKAQGKTMELEKLKKLYTNSFSGAERVPERSAY